MAQEKAEVSGADSSRILVIDANILLRAVLGTRVRSLIERGTASAVRTAEHPAVSNGDLFRERWG